MREPGSQVQEGPRLVYELSLSPAVPGHAISPESVELYVSDTNEKGSYHKLEATVSIDDASGRIIVKASQAILTRYAKVHCILDTRDKNLKAAQARFTNLATGILRIKRRTPTTATTSRATALVPR
jgi:hypothetical protein